MDKRNLYETISSKKNFLNKEVRNKMDFLAYSDGNHNLFQIVNRCNFSLEEGLRISKILKKNKLIN